MLRFAVLTLCLSMSPAFAAEITVPDGKEVSLPGSDVTIRLTGVDDARCPSDVDCYWEG